MTTKAGETVLTVIVRREMSDRLGMLASMMHTSKGALIRWAIEEYLAKKLSA